MMRRHLLAILIGATALASCSRSEAGSVYGPDGPQQITVSSIQLSQTRIAIRRGTTQQLSAIAKDATGATIANIAIAWRSSNSAVATVSADGMVQAVNTGSSTITASAGAASASATVDVSVTPVASVAVSLGASTLTVGQSGSATATVRDASGATLTDRVVTWASSNTAVATVSASGVLSASSAGTTTITATSEGVSGSASLAVQAPAPAAVASVTVSPSSATVATGATTTLSAAMRDASGNVLSGRTVTWSSSATGVATVSASGVVTGVGAGSATIRATSENVTGSAAITVTAPPPPPPPPPAPVASVSVSLSSSTINVGQGSQASAILRDASGNVLSGRAITWQSSNTSVATVSSSGGIGGAAAGTASITATSEGISGSATLTVQAASSGSHEPSGLTQITHTTFGSLTEDGWTPYYNGLSIVADAQAPKSATSVAQLLYPAGFAGGDSPGLVERNLGSSATTLYVSFYMKISSNWSGHPTGTNKILHFWIGGSNHVFFYADGAGTGTLRPYIGLQGVANYGGGVNLAPNLVPSAQVIRGQWQHWEVVLHANAANTADGTVDWWIDGTKVGSYSGINYVNAGGVWELAKWDPTWGGLGGTVPADQFMWMDDIYISGH